MIATGGSKPKLELAREAGADVVCSNRTDDVVAVIKGATGGVGADLVFDHVGPALFQASLFALRPRGRLVFCGTTTGVEATFNLPHAYHFGMRILGADPYKGPEFGEMLAYYWGGGLRAGDRLGVPARRGRRRAGEARFGHRHGQGADRPMTRVVDRPAPAGTVHRPEDSS